jgi:hypothetical protein
MFRFKTTFILSMVLLLTLCAPCLASCSYTVDGNAGAGCYTAKCGTTSDNGICPAGNCSGKENIQPSWAQKVFGENQESETSNSFGDFAQGEVSESKDCASYAEVCEALKQNSIEKTKYDAETYNSKDYALDVCTTMTKAGIDCSIVKVTFESGRTCYINSFETCEGELLVDSCGTAEGTGIKKVVNTLDIGKRMSSTSLFKECTKTYTRGVVALVEYL